LYRLNLRGEFNVPIGSKTKVEFDDGTLEDCSNALKSAQITASDFERTIDQAEAGDFIFVDPPYTVKHNLNGFIKYNEHLFSWDDQVRLRNSLRQASYRGAKVLVTNADHEAVRELYCDDGEMIAVSRQSVIAGRATARQSTTELFVWM
jgi:DNA adenine methylase